MHKLPICTFSSDSLFTISKMSKGMARHLHFLPIQASMAISTTGTVIFIVVAVLAVVSLISFLCASHHHRHSQRLAGKFSAPADQQRKLISNISDISSKALLMAKMISWRKPEVSDREEEEEDESEDAIWKKNIMMGERCRPLDFSGRILYDSQGNRLPEVPKKAKHQIDVSAAAVVPMAKFP
ncbi:hypothetical protein ACLOJK_001487 [Asimina triloba]